MSCRGRRRARPFVAAPSAPLWRRPGGHV